MQDEIDNIKTTVEHIEAEVGDIKTTVEHIEIATHRIESIHIQAGELHRGIELEIIAIRDNTRYTRMLTLSILIFTITHGGVLLAFLHHYVA